jgi:hypothetical protein
MDGFQPIGFPLTIVPVDNVDASTPMDLALQVSEVFCPGRSKEHN